MNTHSTFDRLILQIDTFIKKYYVNQMIKGLLLFTGVLLFSYLFATITEFIGRFNSIIRALLFYGFIVINVFILVRYFIYPLSKLFSFGKRIRLTDPPHACWEWTSNRRSICVPSWERAH